MVMDPMLVRVILGLDLFWESLFMLSGSGPICMLTMLGLWRLLWRCWGSLWGNSGMEIRGLGCLCKVWVWEELQHKYGKLTGTKFNQCKAVRIESCTTYVLSTFCQHTKTQQNPTQSTHLSTTSQTNTQKTTHT